MSVSKARPHSHVAGIHPALRDAITDAVLVGHVKELDDVLTLIALDDDFPETLRYGLEALRHFRAHYGKDGDMRPENWAAQQKAFLLENAWGAELLDILRYSPAAQSGKPDRMGFM